MNSQDLVIGEDDTENDYTDYDHDDEDYENQDENESINNTEMDQEQFDVLVNVLKSNNASQSYGTVIPPSSRLNQWLESQNEATSNPTYNRNSATAKTNNTQIEDGDDLLPDWEKGENDETEIDRWVRMMDEEEKENNGNNVRRVLNNDGVNVNGRLTAPPSEIRKRAKRVKPSKSATSNNIDSNIDDLRKKQTELISEQIKVQKLLFENAYLAQLEMKERIRLAKAQADLAESDLHAKSN